MDEIHARYCGTYYFFGIALDVREASDGLEAAMFGVPEGYEIGLEQVAGPVFRMRGGPLDGAEAEFASGWTGASATA
jgi:hypothetical protein